MTTIDTTGPWPRMRPDPGGLTVGDLRQIVAHLDALPASAPVRVEDPTRGSMAGCAEHPIVAAAWDVPIAENGHPGVLLLIDPSTVG